MRVRDFSKMVPPGQFLSRRENFNHAVPDLFAARLEPFSYTPHGVYNHGGGRGPKQSYNGTQSHTLHQRRNNIAKSIVDRVDDKTYQTAKILYRKVQTNHHLKNWEKLPGSLCIKLDSLFDNLSPPCPDVGFKQAVSTLKEKITAEIKHIMYSHMIMLDKSLDSLLGSIDIEQYDQAEGLCLDWTSKRLKKTTKEMVKNALRTSKGLMLRRFITPNSGVVLPSSVLSHKLDMPMTVEPTLPVAGELARDGFLDADRTGLLVTEEKMDVTGVHTEVISSDLVDCVTTFDLGFDVGSLAPLMKELTTATSLEVVDVVTGPPVNVPTLPMGACSLGPLGPILPLTPRGLKRAFSVVVTEDEQLLPRNLDLESDEEVLEGAVGGEISPTHKNQKLKRTESDPGLTSQESHQATPRVYYQPKNSWSLIVKRNTKGLIIGDQNMKQASGYPGGWEVHSFTDLNFFNIFSILSKFKPSDTLKTLVIAVGINNRTAESKNTWADMLKMHGQIRSLKIKKIMGVGVSTNLSLGPVALSKIEFVNSKLSTLFGSGYIPPLSPEEVKFLPGDNVSHTRETVDKVFATILTRLN